MEITESTKTIVGVTFAFLYEQMYDDKRRAIFSELVDNYAQVLLPNIYFSYISNSIYALRNKLSFMAKVFIN